MQCSSMQGLYTEFTGEDLYIFDWYSGIQGIHARLTGEDLEFIGIFL